MTDTEKLREEIETLKADLITRKQFQAASDARAVKAEEALVAYEKEIEMKRANVQTFVTETLARLKLEVDTISAATAKGREELARCTDRIAELTPERDKLEKVVEVLKNSVREQHAALENLLTGQAESA